MGYVSNIVQRAVEYYNTLDPYEIAKKKGVIIRETPLGETLGYYMKKSRIQFIMINSEITEHIKKFICAHELGHSILHPNSHTPFLRKNTLMSVDKIEREANEFAVNLLLYNKNLEDYETKYDVLRENGIPYEMERFL